MKLTVKNKYIAAMTDLINQAVKTDGIPDQFVLSQTEFALFIKDIWMTTGAKTIPEVTIKVLNKGDEFSIISSIKSKNTLSDQVLKELVDKWVKREYSILYKNIPVVFTAGDSKDTDPANCW